MPGTVYFAPPNYHLLVEAGPQLALSADDLVHHSRPSIDVLFDSAAEVYREHLLGIILSGANEDGAEGLAAVHDAGGLTVVQEPADRAVLDHDTFSARAAARGPRAGLARHRGAAAAIVPERAAQEGLRFGRSHVAADQVLAGR